jgi:uncharacterized protein (DUF1015 family)
VTIADGHHRYETALRYRDTPGSPPGSDHVLALFYSAANDGLALAPWHRVISGLDDLATTAALGRARELFRTGDVSDSDELITAVDAGRQLGFLGVWTRNGGSVLEVDPQRTPSSVGTDSSENLRSLDVSVLSGTLSRMVGHTESELAAQGRLSYTHDANEAVAAVNEGRADVCFLLRPTPVEQVMAVAAAGEFMPAKSTYFYPKAATGLVFDPLS